MFSIFKKRTFLVPGILFLSAVIFFSYQFLIQEKSSEELLGSDSLEEAEVLADNKVIVDKSTNSVSLDTKDSTSNVNVSQAAIIFTHAEYPEWIGSAKGIVQNTDAIFVAKVIQKVGDKALHRRIPGTQYSVTVLENIKGSVGTNAVVSQAGVGYRDGRLYAVEGGMLVPAGSEPTSQDVFFKQGGTYVFAAKYDKENDWYTVSAPGFDRELITTNAALTDEQLRALADKNAKVQEFKAAVIELNQ